jgi:hypothetical protein
MVYQKNWFRSNYSKLSNIKTQRQQVLNGVQIQENALKFIWNAYWNRN